MSRSAFLNGSEIILPIPDEEWELLQQRSRAKEITFQMPNCGCPAFMRMSRLGEQHFVHCRSCGSDTGPTSKEHEEIKQEIVEACKELGIHAEGEHDGEAWRSDVFVPAANISFEVQWSAQSFVETLRRQKRYLKDQISCIWLFRNMPERRPLSERYLDTAPQKITPMYPLRLIGTTPLSFGVDMNPSRSRRVPLRTFVHDVLARRLQIRRSPAVGVRATLSIYRVRCSFCQWPISFLRLKGVFANMPCGASIPVPHRRCSFVFPRAYSRLFKPLLRRYDIYGLYSKENDPECYRFCCRYCDRGSVINVPHSKTKGLRRVKNISVGAEIASESPMLLDHWCSDPACVPVTDESDDGMDSSVILLRRDLEWCC